MTFPKGVKALFFDVFGTCVDWRTTVTKALEKAASAALESSACAVLPAVREKASRADWGRFAQEWRISYIRFVQAVAADPSIPFKTIDEHHLDSLKELLSSWRLSGLWTDDQVVDLSLVWHRLDAWEDSSAGLKALNDAGFQTATLSNGNISLLQDLKDHGSMPFTHLFSGEMFNSYKPSPKVYLGAVEKLGLQPNECALVAAHLGDLKAAKGCGLYAIYVERPMEEGWSSDAAEQARKEGWVDLWIGQEQNGFLAVARELSSRASL